MSQDMRMERVKHVHSHLTPLAILAVAPGLMFTDIPESHRVLGAVLFFYAIMMNYLSMYLITHKKNVDDIAKLRVVSNYVTNIGLACILYQAWPMVWLLLLMMSIGPAIYQPRREAMGSAGAVAMMLLAVHYFFGEPGLGPWLEALARGGAIVLLGLFVNGLAVLAPQPS
jgi:hypothetical protein